MAKKKITGKVDPGDGDWKGREIVGCTIKALPAKEKLEAAVTAIRISPTNRPKTTGLSKVLDQAAYVDVMKPLAIAALTTKYWGNTGVKLTVSFMETTTRALADKIISHMNAWATVAHANVDFTYVAKDGDVRISRGSGGYWSYLGTDILHIPKNQQTMNLEGFLLSTPESEYMRVIRHETGHTLGFPHEHMRKEIVALLDVQKTIKYFEQSQGWSESEVRAQVLTPLSDKSLMETPADVNSIMCYQLPGSITTTGKPIPGGVDIDASDAAFAAKLYPVAVTPPTPPVTPPDPATPPPPVLVGSVRVDLTKKTVFYPAGWNAQQGV